LRHVSRWIVLGEAIKSRPYHIHSLSIPSAMSAIRPADRKSNAMTTAWRRDVRHRLLAWYRKNARDLPWRRTRDPYAIWISEIMLQQTQVATVERYFAKFMAAFPTIAALAAAPEQHVLRLWEGLGYYRRARQLHAAAKTIVTEHGGRFPSDFASLRQLPGIGRYTAGAILSIAFDIPAPILEANTVRLLTRLLAFRGDTASGKGQKLLWQAAEDFLPRRGSGQFNQALMELGSLICTPRNPQCGNCPLNSLCPTRRGGWQQRIPAARRQPVVEDVQEAAVLIVHRGTVLLRKCGPGERWAGLWDFPRFPLERSKLKAKTWNSNSIKPRPPVAPSRKQDIVNGVRQMVGVTITRPQYFATLRHSVTRFRITLDCFTAQCGKLNRHQTAVTSTNGHGELRWIKPQELDDYPLCTTGRKLARLWRETQTDTPQSKHSH
jgi:A/G-specific adenine glycosylase